MKRRHFIQTTGFSLGALFLSDVFMYHSRNAKSAALSYPIEVYAIVNGQLVKLIRRDDMYWAYKTTSVGLKNSETGMEISIHAPGMKLSTVYLNWKTPVRKKSVVLNDHWERTYGDVCWHTPDASEILPWYFLAYNGKNTHGFGVKTGPSCFCSWQVSANKLSLMLDTRSGGTGVELGERTLKAAEIVTIKGETGEPAFTTARKFMKAMCPAARMPTAPVYGINDWYFTYGNNSEKKILEHTELMAPLADGLNNRPFSVIDAGWFQNSSTLPDDCCWGDNMSTPDARFGDMKKLAEKIKSMGMRPGIWTRPLCGSEKDSASSMLPPIRGREKNKPVLDPTIAENMERIKNYFKLYNNWGYEMVKFDFTSFDLFGKWGFEMLKEKALTADQWSMYDRSKTNAEIVLDLYHAIREAAGKMYIIGCNTFSHLSAGLFELNRIGDDTSGNEWERTRKMGVNTLAFRSMHQGIFYEADGDCVGLTPKVSWEKNRQWMELLAKSGTPLFISAQPEATGVQQKATIKKCFELASQNLPVAEPLDWMETPFPERWKLNGEVFSFNWD